MAASERKRQQSSVTHTFTSSPRVSALPDDRFLHRRAGHGQKTAQLSSDEFRVWVQYLLSADDFGVMRCSATTLRSDNAFLGMKPERMVARWLEAVVAVGLVLTFEHQGRRYVYQPDWQDYQKVRWPAK